MRKEEEKAGGLRVEYSCSKLCGGREPKHCCGRSDAKCRDCLWCLKSLSYMARKEGKGETEREEREQTNPQEY